MGRLPWSAEGQLVHGITGGSTDSNSKGTPPPTLSKGEGLPCADVSAHRNNK